MRLGSPPHQSGIAARPIARDAPEVFLSTFVMIGQNRQATFQQEKEFDENTVLTREIHRLTVELHALRTGMQKP